MPMKMEETLFPKTKRGKIVSNKEEEFIHPRFKTITDDEAYELLAKEEDGCAILRPSLTKGPEFLILTIRVCEKVYRSHLVEQFIKSARDPASRALIIKDEKFCGMDDLFERFVGPLKHYYSQCFCHRSFRSHTMLLQSDVKICNIETECDLLFFLKKSVQAGTRRSSSLVPCAASISIKFPSAIVIVASVYDPITKDTRFKEHYVSVKQEGFIWGNKSINRFSKLIEEIKHCVLEDKPKSISATKRSSSKLH